MIVIYLNCRLSFSTIKLKKITIFWNLTDQLLLSFYWSSIINFFSTENPNMVDSLFSLMIYLSSRVYRVYSSNRDYSQYFRSIPYFLLWFTYRRESMGLYLIEIIIHVYLHLKLLHIHLKPLHLHLKLLLIHLKLFHKNFLRRPTFQQFLDRVWASNRSCYLYKRNYHLTSQLDLTSLPFTHKYPDSEENIHSLIINHGS